MTKKAELAEAYVESFWGAREELDQDEERLAFDNEVKTFLAGHAAGIAQAEKLVGDINSVAILAMTISDGAEGRGLKEAISGDARLIIKICDKMIARFKAPTCECRYPNSCEICWPAVKPEPPPTQARDRQVSTSQNLTKEAPREALHEFAIPGEPFFSEQVLMIEKSAYEALERELLSLGADLKLSEQSYASLSQLLTQARAELAEAIKDRDDAEKGEAKWALKSAALVEACNLYESAFADTGIDFSHLVCLIAAREALAKYWESK